MDMDKTSKPWRCEKCGVPLGYVLDGRLRLLDMSLIDCGDIHCGNCGTVRKFYPDPHGLDAKLDDLLERVRALGEWAEGGCE